MKKYVLQIHKLHFVEVLSGLYVHHSQKTADFAFILYLKISVKYYHHHNNNNNNYNNNKLLMQKPATVLFLLHLLRTFFFKATEVVIAHTVATHQHLQSWGEKSLLTEWEIGVKLFSFRFLTISFKYYKKKWFARWKNTQGCNFP